MKRKNNFKARKKKILRNLYSLKQYPRHMKIQLFKHSSCLQDHKFKSSPAYLPPPPHLPPPHLQLIQRSAFCCLEADIIILLGTWTPQLEGGVRSTNVMKKDVLDLWQNGLTCVIIWGIMQEINPFVVLLRDVVRCSLSKVTWESISQTLIRSQA